MVFFTSLKVDGATDVELAVQGVGCFVGVHGGILLYLSISTASSSEIF
jgi:hypothetical protein